jgi:hypothetical protein
MRTTVLVAAIFVGYVLGASGQSSRDRAPAAEPVNRRTSSAVVRAERTDRAGVESGVTRHPGTASTVRIEPNQGPPPAVK